MAYPTNPIYKLVKNELKDNIVDQVMTVKGSRTFLIPFAEGNTDYQEYLEWAKTNTPEEAD